MLSNKMKVNNQYKEYLENKYSVSKKTFFLLSQSKLENQSFFGKVNHAILRYTNSNSYIKTSRNALIFNYIRSLINDVTKTNSFKTNTLLKDKYFQKLDIFSNNKLKIYKTLNKGGLSVLKGGLHFNPKINKEFKNFKKASKIKLCNFQSVPKNISKISKIRSNREISLKLKEISIKMKDRDLLLKNYISKEVQRLVITYVNLFQTAHKQYIEKKVNSFQIQKFEATKFKTRKNFINKN
jgi:hypothetical protein